MPTVMRSGPYHFFFYSNEGSEPRHVHVRYGDSEAKFWLEPLTLAWPLGLNDRQLAQVKRHIDDNLAFLIESWDKLLGARS